MSSRITYAVSFLLAAGGFLWPFWPLSVLGIILSALTGRWIFAVFMGLLLDVAWSIPTGVWDTIYLPFTALAVVVALLRYFFADYFLDRSPTDTL
ncbi:MAG: hypothetical protein V4474_03615 [Patescibacteria group bacterium]